MNINVVQVLKVILAKAISPELEAQMLDQLTLALNTPMAKAVLAAKSFRPDVSSLQGFVMSLPQLKGKVSVDEVRFAFSHILQNSDEIHAFVYDLIKNLEPVLGFDLSRVVTTDDLFEKVLRLPVTSVIEGEIFEQKHITATCPTCSDTFLV